MRVLHIRRSEIVSSDLERLRLEYVLRNVGANMNPDRLIRIADARAAFARELRDASKNPQNESARYHRRQLLISARAYYSLARRSQS
jgi:hypothetical protein